MPYLIFPAVALGIFAAFFLVGYVMIHRDEPRDRALFLINVLIADVVALAATTYFLPIAASVVFTFTLTKCLIWCIMSHRNVIYFDNTKE